MQKLVNSVTLFASIFSFHILWIFQGVDVTDLGYHLTNQVNFFTEGADSVFVPMTFLSDFVGGIWLTIIDKPNIVWARLGGVLLYALTATISYKILKDYYDPRQVFFVVFATSVIITVRVPTTIIDYFNFPAFLLNLELFIFSRLLNEPAQSWRVKLYSWLLGFMTIPIILSRFPLILIGFVPVLVYLHHKISKTDMIQLGRSSIYLISGVLISTTLFAVFLGRIGYLNVFLETVKEELLVAFGRKKELVVDKHGAVEMLNLYFMDYAQVFYIIIVGIVVLYLCSIIRDRAGSYVAIFTLIICCILGALSLAYTFNVAFYTTKLVDFFAYSLIHLQIAIIFTLSGIFFYYYRGRSVRIGLLVLLSAYIMVINPLGSNTGIFKSAYGMWLVLPLVFLISYELRFTNSTPARLKSILSWNTMIIFSMLSLAVAFHFTNSYRDLPNRFKLNTHFNYKYLQNVYSFKDRVKVVDEVLMEIDRLTSPGDSVLMLRRIPLFYYLTETKPFFGVSWLFVQPLKRIKEFYHQALHRNRFPKIIVSSKTNTTHYNWPNLRKVSNDPKLDWLMNRYISDFSFKLVWENSAFSIYSRPLSLEKH